MLPCPWLIRSTGSGVCPGTVRNAARYMGRFFSSKLLDENQIAWRKLLRAFFLSLLRKEIVQILPTVLAVILPLPVFGFLGDVLPIQHMLQAATAEMFCIPRSFTPHWAFSFTHFGKMFIIGSGTDGSKSYKRQRVGWTWLYVGLRVTDEVETNWCGCGAGKFADGKLYGSWKTAWWALGPSSELKEQHCPPGSSSLGRRWQGILAEWMAKVRFVEKLQEKVQELHQREMNVKDSMRNLARLCSFYPKSGKIWNSVCRSKTGFFSVVSESQYLLEVGLLFKKGWQELTSLWTSSLFDESTQKRRINRADEGCKAAKSNHRMNYFRAVCCY